MTKAIAHGAFKALVNLSDSSLLTPSLSDPLFLGFLVSYIVVCAVRRFFSVRIFERCRLQNPPSVLADLASMLLSNVTGFPMAVNNLLSLEIPLLPLPSSSTPYYPPSSRCGTSPYPEPYPGGTPTQVRALRVLVDAFVNAAEVPSSTDDEEGTRKSDTVRNRKGELHFLANVFANITVVRVSSNADAQYDVEGSLAYIAGPRWEVVFLHTHLADSTRIPPKRQGP